MKITSKSILSPGRPRDQPITLTTSLSRRLRTNGSMKGAQSPMFPNIIAAAAAAGGKKRGASAFENPEPSSPKVTCIGQVRVKTKKQGRKMRTRTLSGTRNDAGEVSFRTGDSSGRRNNQRWVHLPFTICEALRGIGADFNCLFPCRSSSSSSSSSCFSGGERNQNLNQNQNRSSCGAVFERWFVTIDEEGKGGGGREIELVVAGGDEETENPLVKERRRHPLEMFNQGEDEPRVSICIPPKNALLLMRCRSDPVQMEALSTRLFDNPPVPNDAENGVPVEEEEEMNDDEDENKGSGYSSEADAELVKLLESEEEEEEDERRKSHDFSLLFSEESNQDADEDDENGKTEDPLKEFTEAGEMETTSNTHETSPSEEEERLELLEEKKEIPAPTLPDCLLLMMCEPKLSMEVSKETWVCSTDFIRSIPPESKKRVPPLPPQAPVVAPPATVPQPPRSSCTLPSMAAMIEQKLINAVGYEPFVLTRCKSEPMRTAAAKLAPESCFWKNRKLEPLRRATLGIGAAGIGF